jgi:hypothetical protein
MRIMSKEKYKEFFIDHMMIQELGMEVPDPDDSPAKAGLAMFIAFLIFGGLPLYPYIIFALTKWSNQFGQFAICCVMTVIALFALGVMQVCAVSCCTGSLCFFLCTARCVLRAIVARANPLVCFVAFSSGTIHSAVVDPQWPGHGVRRLAHCCRRLSHRLVSRRRSGRQRHHLLVPVCISIALSRPSVNQSQDHELP